ncbi:unnamed protein product [Protopolystoma xenopodis]|uniref:Ataxin-3 homolog n=1 Tax=Protopolystoma xenopodis TaxID=117903 RepID=A0A3S5BU20_9PLAT|nr:unnamed protein product [Protopolystoma xenopodis]
MGLCIECLFYVHILLSLRTQMESIFHERQDGSLCAQHCLNALLQGPYFTVVDLADIARKLDDEESQSLGISNPGKSQNMDESGMFSVQVIKNFLD